MAFISKLGNVLKQTVSGRVNSELSASNPSVFQAIRCMSSSKLFVGGLSYNTDDQGLRDAFTAYGEVIEARVIMDRETGRSRGFGFVSYTSSEEASSAIQALDGQDLQGRRVRVNYATDRAGGFRSGGYGGSGGDNSYGSGGGSYGGSGGSGFGGTGNYGGGGGGYGSVGGYGGGDVAGDGSSAGSGSYGVAGGGDGSFASGSFGGSTGFGGDQYGSNLDKSAVPAEGHGQADPEGSFMDNDDEPDDYANKRG
ncbi:glycine-rich RNA-binding protein 3, mitochondrial-like isoform X2 [Telopea speciosissima]|uniref:glycine-rich RNA-binding protein 3, mitochondrial-like isoform X2 n=1 Tax=Telopea speciosissima TaxID=54955 RepID=UPI001CC7352A|nr:glycine-rich RNA-binding protein 3, mitochondrial-like isoform X2 [Telopea speciosissima]